MVENIRRKSRNSQNRQAYTSDDASKAAKAASLLFNKTNNQVSSHSLSHSKSSQKLGPINLPTKQKINLPDYYTTNNQNVTRYSNEKFKQKINSNKSTVIAGQNSLINGIIGSREINANVNSSELTDDNANKISPKNEDLKMIYGLHVGHTMSDNKSYTGLSQKQLPFSSSKSNLGLNLNLPVNSQILNNKLINRSSAVKSNNIFISNSSNPLSAGTKQEKVHQTKHASSDPNVVSAHFSSLTSSTSQINLLNSFHRKSKSSFSALAAANKAINSSKSILNNSLNVSHSSFPTCCPNTNLRTNKNTFYRKTIDNTYSNSHEGRLTRKYPQAALFNKDISVMKGNNDFLILHTTLNNNVDQPKVIYSDQPSFSIISDSKPLSGLKYYPILNGIKNSSDSILLARSSGFSTESSLSLKGNNHSRVFKGELNNNKKNTSFSAVSCSSSLNSLPALNLNHHLKGSSNSQSFNQPIENYIETGCFKPISGSTHKVDFSKTIPHSTNVLGKVQIKKPKSSEAQPHGENLDTTQGLFSKNFDQDKLFDTCPDFFLSNSICWAPSDHCILEKNSANQLETFDHSEVEGPIDKINVSQDFATITNRADSIPLNTTSQSSRSNKNGAAHLQIFANKIFCDSFPFEKDKKNTMIKCSSDLLPLTAEENSKVNPVTTPLGFYGGEELGLSKSPVRKPPPENLNSGFQHDSATKVEDATFDYFYEYEKYAKFDFHASDQQTDLFLEEKNYPNDIQDGFTNMDLLKNDEVNKINYPIFDKNKLNYSENTFGKMNNSLEPKAKDQTEASNQENGANTPQEIFSNLPQYTLLPRINEGNARQKIKTTALLM
ncbi:uncharacterized protein ASCRUDRAFT_73769, partial [Ascoidea rubescens DSM 1968]